METGSIKLQLSFTNKDIVDGNENYGLDGAIFEIVKDRKSFGIMKTDVDGVAEMREIPPGQYEIHQVSPCRGGVCDYKTAYDINVVPGDVSIVNVNTM